MANLVPALNGTLINHDDCTLDICSMDYAQMSYVPSLVGNSVYLGLFGAILITQISLGIIYKTWGFMIGMICGLILEILGYLGRIMLHNNPFSFDSFLLYLVPLTIGPAFLSASIYLCLGRIIIVYGQNLSRFRPRTYAILFMSCDLLSLILQAAGGALASIGDAGSSLQDTGVNVMIAGLVFQVVSLALYMALWGEFAYRVWRAPENQRNARFTDLRNSLSFKLFQFALFAATIFIFVRSVFRVAELQEGFNGDLANNQTIFMILEGPMIIAATAALAVFHPGVSFAGNWSAAAWSLRKKDYAEVRSKADTSSVELQQV